MDTIDGIFSIDSSSSFLTKALDIFHHQYHTNRVYREFCNYLNVNPDDVRNLEGIPFLPIEFFKTKTILSGNENPKITFTSSGTTGSQVSRHIITDLKLYEESFSRAFELFYGDVKDYCVLALLPSYLEREGSSLIYMVDKLIEKSKHVESGFYLDDLGDLTHRLLALQNSGSKVLLIGVSFALLDLAEIKKLDLKNTVIMETGGMKGRRKEMIRNELHTLLKEAFGVKQIHSEYGMTELLSQAYSSGNGIFKCPPWMKIMTRDTEDPLSIQAHGKTGGINVIDLANVNSCSFIATQDLGKTFEDGSFEILGRFDHSDVRGCNLMVV